jgi:hypothetical protein
MCLPYIPSHHPLFLLVPQAIKRFIDWTGVLFAQSFLFYKIFSARYAFCGTIPFLVSEVKPILTLQQFFIVVNFFF